MNILVVNAGSTSLKIDVFTMPEESCVASAAVQRIGKADATLRIRIGDQPASDSTMMIADHDAALQRVLEPIVDRVAIGAVGHRVVHGGEKLCTPTVIDEEVVRTIGDHTPFAPLHNPANLSGIRAARSRLATVPHVAVMDTGFHHTLPPEAYLYGLPYELYQRHGIRRYGFHGTSHEYVANQAAALLARELDELRLITCHLGGGASVCAIEGGRSVDTSMGMTPLEGLVMGTRSGDLDPGIVLYLQDRLAMTATQISDLLNRESGIKGISGASRDMRELLALADRGNQRASLAVDIFCRRVRHYIGGYLAQLGGADAVVFTGGIGENSAIIRANIVAGLAALGIDIDEAKNESGAPVISTPTSRTAVLVIPTDEELQIARAVCASIG